LQCLSASAGVCQTEIERVSVCTHTRTCEKMFGMCWVGVYVGARVRACVYVRACVRACVRVCVCVCVCVCAGEGRGRTPLSRMFSRVCSAAMRRTHGQNTRGGHGGARPPAHSTTAPPQHPRHSDAHHRAPAPPPPSHLPNPSSFFGYPSQHQQHPNYFSPPAHFYGHTSHVGHPLPPQYYSDHYREFMRPPPPYPHMYSLPPHGAPPPFNFPGGFHGGAPPPNYWGASRNSGGSAGDQPPSLFQRSFSFNGRVPDDILDSFRASGVLLLAQGPSEMAFFLGAEDRSKKRSGLHRVWTNFGGKRNENETPAQTATRELHEETGYLFKDLCDMVYAAISDTHAHERTAGERADERASDARHSDGGAGRKDIDNAEIGNNSSSKDNSSHHHNHHHHHHTITNTHNADANANTSSNSSSGGGSAALRADCVLKAWYGPGKYVLYVVRVPFDPRAPERFGQLNTEQLVHTDQVELSWVPVRTVLQGAARPAPHEFDHNHTRENLFSFFVQLLRCRAVAEALAHMQ